MPKRTLLIKLLIVIPTASVADVFPYINKKLAQPQEEFTISPSIEQEEIAPGTTPTEPSKIDTSNWKIYRVRSMGLKSNIPKVGE